LKKASSEGAGSATVVALATMSVPKTSVSRTATDPEAACHSRASRLDPHPDGSGLVPDLVEGEPEGTGQRRRGYRLDDVEGEPVVDDPLQLGRQVAGDSRIATAQSMGGRTKSRKSIRASTGGSSSTRTAPLAMTYRIRLAGMPVCVPLVHRTDSRLSCSARITVQPV
jgi:hypothetical protein